MYQEMAQSRSSLQGINATNQESRAPRPSGLLVSTSSGTASADNKLMKQLAKYLQYMFSLSFLLFLTFWGTVAGCFLGFMAAIFGMTTSCMFQSSTGNCCSHDSVVPNDVHSKRRKFLFSESHCCCCRKKGIYHLQGMVITTLIFHALTACVYLPMGAVMLNQSKKECRNYWDYYYYDDEYWVEDPYDDWGKHDGEKVSLR